MWSVLMPHQKKGSNLQPTDVLKFDWDIEDKPTLSLDEQLQQIKESKQVWDNIDKKRNGSTNS